MMDWWEIKSDIKPILGMNNFGKLNLRIVQGKMEKIGLVGAETEKLMFNQKSEHEFGELFNRQGTIRNFEYGLEFKDDFVPFHTSATSRPTRIDKIDEFGTSNEIRRYWRRHLPESGSNSKEKRITCQDRT